MSHLARLSFPKDRLAERTVKSLANLDLFIGVLNFTHCVVKKGYYLAIISTMVETDDPTSELKPAFEVIGDVLETFITISDLYEPIDSTFKDNVINSHNLLGLRIYFF